MQRTIQKRYLATLLLPAFLQGEAATPVQQAPPAENRPVTTPKTLQCDPKALSPAQRAQHQKLTEKLLAVRTQIVETPKGYEFQYRPADISLAELAEWAAAESKCCPFFDFHIDLENAATLLCLRLTGAEGVKDVIRTAFRVTP